MRRLMGAVVAFAAVFVLVSLLPEAGPIEPLPADASASRRQQVVIYDLRAPVAVPLTVAAAKPTALPQPPPVKTVTPANARAGWYVQLGTYASAANARAVLARMQAAGQPGFVQEAPPSPDAKKESPKDVKTPPLFRVRLGAFSSAAEARQAQQFAVGEGFTGAQIVELR